MADLQQDMRNHGHSPHAQPTDYATMAYDILHFCDAHKLHEISLLGHSMCAPSSLLAWFTKRYTLGAERQRWRSHYVQTSRKD